MSRSETRYILSFATLKISADNQLTVELNPKKNQNKYDEWKKRCGLNLFNGQNRVPIPSERSNGSFVTFILK